MFAPAASQVAARSPGAFPRFCLYTLEVSIPMATAKAAKATTASAPRKRAAKPKSETAAKPAAKRAPRAKAATKATPTKTTAAKTTRKAAPRKLTVKAATPKAAPVEQVSSEESFSEQVARLAYQFWEERGRPEGSSHEDWYRAEQELASKQA